MDSLNIIVFGDIEFIYRAMQAVADIYSHSDMHKFAGALIALFLLWSFVKWTIAPEKSPYPAREFVLGLVLYMAFGGLPSLSPKFTVNLLYDPYMYSSPPSGPRVVENVPALVALPYYMTTNLFSGLRNLVLPRFQVTGVPQSSGAATTPLHTLVRMYGMSETEVIDPHLEKSIDHYMRECFVYWYSLPGGSASDNASKIVAANVAGPNFWNAMALPPAANWIHTRFYTQAIPNGEIVQCTDSADSAHAKIAAELPNYRNAIAERLASQGFLSTDTMNSALFLQQALTSGTVTPHDLMTGLFVQQHIRSGLQGSNLGAWADKMVLEGGRQHVFQKAGESNLFVQIMIPVITAIEAFAVFIGPILMLLTVLGGMGLALIGKYLMLSLFIGLWGFLKVFTDWFAAVIALRAIQASAVEQSNPLTMGNVYQTFQEIEFYLGVAASLTVSIPFFSMFLLYGGIHSVMGVMRTIGTPQADGANMAPSMASTMNGGTMSMGDSVYQRNVSTGTWNNAVGASYAQPANMQTRSTSSVTTAGQESSVQLARQELQSAITGFTRSFASNDDFRATWSHLESGGTMDSGQMQNAHQKLASLVYTMTQGDSTKKEEALQAIFQASASGGASLGFRVGGNSSSPWGSIGGGMKADVSGAFKVSGSDGLSQAQTEMLQKAQGHLDADTELASAIKGYNWSEVFSTDNAGSTGAQYSEQNTSARTLATAHSRMSSLTESYGNVSALTSSMSLHVGAMEPTFGALASDVEDSIKQMAPKADFSSALIENHGIVTETMFALTQDYADGASTLQEKGERYGQLAKFWQDKANYFPAGTEQNTQLSHLSDNYRQLSEAITSPDRQGQHHLVPDTVESAIDKGADQAMAHERAIDDGQQRVLQQTAGMEDAVAGGHDAAHDGIDEVRRKTTDVDGPSQPMVERINRANEQRERAFADREQLFNMMQSGARLGISAMEGVSNIVDFFRGPARLWGEDAENDGARMQSLFAASGNSSGQIQTGWSALAKNGMQNVNSQFKDNTPTAEAYAMNDTIMSMRAAFGEKWTDVIDTSSENGQRFLEAVGAFQTAKNALPQHIQEQMDAVSEFRINGELPDSAAQQLISNNGQNQLTTAPAANSDERAAMWIVQNNDNLRENDHIRRLAGYTPNADRPAPPDQPDGPRIPTPREAGASQLAQDKAFRMFTNDEKDRIIASGEHQIDPYDGFVPGVNRDYKPDDLERGLSQYLSGQRDNRHGASIIPDAQNDRANRNHAAFLASANSGLGNLAERLEQGGFTQSAASLREQQHRDIAQWTQEGIILTPQTRQEMQRIGEATLNGLSVDTSGAERARAVVPTQISGDTQLIWSGGQRTDGRYEAHITPSGYESPVVISNTASGTAFPVGATRPGQATVDASQRDAVRNFTVSATQVSFDYNNTRAGFYAAKNQNEGNPPAEFISRDGNSRFKGTPQDDGTWRYTDQGNHSFNQGSFTFYPDARNGQGEFRPATDNHWFDEQPRSPVKDKS